MDGTVESAPAREELAPSPTPAELARALAVTLETGERLHRAGLTTPEKARAATADALERAGVSKAEIDRIHGPGAAAGSASGPTPVDPDKIVERWAGTVRRPDRARRRRVAPAAKESTDLLRKWVDGDDRAMEDWIRSSEPPTAPAPYPNAPAGPADVVRPAAASPDATVNPIFEREETVVRWLTGLLDRVKSDQFDPATMVQEVQDLHRQLFDERAKRKQLEDEVEHVKRGSIAVIKYVRSREAKDREVAVRGKDDEIAELKLRLLGFESGSGSRPAAEPSPTAPVAAPDPAGPAAESTEKAAREIEQRLRTEFADRESDYVERETELRRRIVSLEGEIRNLTSETERARDRESLLAKDRGAVTEEVEHRLAEVDQREKDLVTRENELRTRFEEIRINAEELERRRSPLEFKERELAAYDQQLQTRRQALDIEARRLEGMRREMGATGVAGDEGRRLDDLRHELSQKEAELRARETELLARVQELERMGSNAAEAEAKQLHDDAKAAANEIKVRSGVRRLDDLLFGGFPPGVQVLVNGPAHTGKDVLARLFSVEGLKLGIPSIWVVTDKTYLQVRDDLAALFPGLADAEKKGLLRYVDLYSRAVGSVASNPNARLLSSTDKAVLDQLATSVNQYAEELKEHFATYRLIFESVSTISAYLDTAATFRFLQPFVGRRKIDRAVAYYVLDSGMHSESDVETLEHMVDGSINLKVEQMKTFLSVRGVADAQARAWIGYTFNKRSLNLGSFSLEHIR